MNVLRWLLFLPIAGLVAAVAGLAVDGLFPERSFYPEHALLSIVHPRGLAGFILPRFVGVTVGILLGSLLAPGSGRKVVVALAILAGLFSLPLPTWPGADVPQ